MRWTRIAQLELKRTERRDEWSPVNEAWLMSRGGLKGVLVNHDGYEIHIPREVILGLVADELQSNMIAFWESQDGPALQLHDARAWR